MIVEGQIAGGVAQGIGMAMLERHIRYDESGQILTTSLDGLSDPDRLRMLPSARIRSY